MGGILLLWLNAFFFLRIWDSTGYLARMILEVLADMKVFFMIYVMFHFMFAHTFFYISKASKADHRFLDDYFHAFRYSYLTALGDFQYKPFFDGSAEVNGKMVHYYDNPLRLIGWTCIILDTLGTCIVLLNLLIAIISGRFSYVKENQVLFMY